MPRGRPRIEDMPLEARVARLEERVLSLHRKLDQANANHRYYVSKRMPTRVKKEKAMDMAIKRYNAFANLVGIATVEEAGS